MIEEKAKELGVELYVPSYEHDLLLFKWWMELQNSGDFETLFANSQRPLSKFIELFQPPRMLTFTCDESGNINHVIWFTPFSDAADAAFVGFWLHKDLRGTRHSVQVTNFVYSVAFQMFKTLIGVTKHEHLLRIHRKLGYNIVGQIPHLMEGDDAWIVYLTKENFENSTFRKVEKRI